MAASLRWSTKFDARNFTLARMKRRAEEIDKSIERYLRQLDAMDQGPAVVTEAQA